ncbi:hypothetical protein DCAR_0312344 [Daucus carota subsp. sativus]|uniref:Bola-like protein n=1 Tax=Daucus carota subsp. sativus TaxID=79200 RepID=A0AAF0WRA6_DAUCS|nr:hypothetical protein DCAR_0312344 [Daucus carota subsp. sativus]
MPESHIISVKGLLFFFIEPSPSNQGGGIKIPVNNTHGIDVIASTFEGQSAVNRQRMVYKAIWEELQSTVHAVDQMTTRTATEAESKK